MQRITDSGIRYSLREWLNGAWAVFEKDVRLELRSRYAINMLLMFVAATLFLIVVSIGNAEIQEQVQAALVWMVQVFASVIGLGRGFVSEVEQGTVLMLQLHTRAGMVYAGKLLFNFILLLLVNGLALLAFLFLMNANGNAAQLATLLVLGALGLSGTTTLLAAIIARTNQRGPLLAVLAFPMLIPLLLAVVKATKSTLAGAPWSFIQSEVMTLIAFAGAVITASVLLFDFVWNE